MAATTTITRTGVAALALPRVDELIDTAVGHVAALGGGPFSALLLDAGTGAVLARGVNTVTASPDPTAHAEVVALRRASRALHRFSLEGTVLLASCEPCPMCLAASLWARVDAIAYVATRTDAAAAGFDDARFHSALGIVDPLPPDLAGTLVVPVQHARACDPFDAWARVAERIDY